MNAARFRTLALALPEAEESEHMAHPDFRVRGKIFATLGPDETWAGLKLTPEQQAALVRAEPDAYAAVPGGWGARGFTRVSLRAARVKSVREALILAWVNTAPRRLVREHFQD
ncbi:MAG: MmcQ/YjbR family DNA-binding protein [Planctomycetota bacterium]